MREKLKHFRFWRPVARNVVRPTVRRFGKRGAVVLLGIPAALIIGSGAYASLLLATGGGNINLQSGLVGWWKLDGNAIDSSSSGDNGTINGAAATTDRNGGANGAMAFNSASNNYISLNNLSIPTDISVSAWVYSTNFTQQGMIVVKNPVNAEWEFFFENNGKLVWNTSGGYSVSASCAHPSNSAWHHVVATQSGTTATIYIDGSQCFTGTKNAIGNASGEIDIGRYTGGYYFNGSIDDVRIYNRAISANEVNALYQSYNPVLNVASGEKSLIGRWRLNGNAKDDTPYARNGTITGSPTPTTDREGAANSAYAFSGTGQYISIPNFDSTVMRQGQEGAKWTMSIWTTGGSLNGILFGKVGFNGGILQNGTTYTFSLWSSAPASLTISKTGNDTSKWHLLTAVYDAGTMYFYVDGVLAGSRAGPGTMYNYGTTLGIGSGGSNSWLSNATLSDARVYGRALSQQDITRLYESYNSQINLYRSAGSSGSAADIVSGLVGHWSFTGNAKDSTPYSDNGTVTGATLAADRFGLSNRAYSFDGTNQYINLGSPSVLNITGDLTINAWIKLNTTSQAAILSWANSYSTFPYHFVTTGTNPPKLRLNRSTYTKDSTDSFSTGVWTMVTVTVSGNQLNYYFNASPDSANPQTTTGTVPSGNGYLTISRNGTQMFNGSIDDVRVYKRALSATDIQALYNLTE